MISLATLLPYIGACLLFSAIPGPGVSVVIANSLAGRTRAGLSTILGTQISMLSMVFIVAVGLEAVMTVVASAFIVIKVVGAAYLIWIGWKMFRSSGKLNLDGGDRLPLRRYVLQGALVNWSNPKTFLFLGAFLPQFVDRSQATFSQIMILGLIVMAVATASDSLYAFAAGQARHLLTTARVRMLNRVSGLILMCGGVWLALVKRS